MREYHIVAVSKTEAERILDSGSAREEQKRVAEVSAAFKKTLGSALNGRMSISTGGGSSLVADDAPAVANGPNPQFLSLIESFNKEEITDERASEQLRQMVNAGAISLQQLQMSAMSVKNTSSLLFRTIEGEISALDSGMARGTGGAGSNTAPSF
jgi:hypothetical protein